MNELESLIKKAASEASLATVLEMRDLSNISELVKSAGWDAIPKMWNTAKGMWGATKGWAKAHPYKAHGINTGLSALGTLGTAGTIYALTNGDDEERNAAVEKSQDRRAHV